MCEYGSFSGDRQVNELQSWPNWSFLHMSKQIKDLLIYTDAYEENSRFCLVYQPVYGSLFFIQYTFSAFQKPTLMSKKNPVHKKTPYHMKKCSNTLIPPRGKKKEEISAFAVFTFPGKGKYTLLFL